jgi:hypothetical protein
VPESIVLVIIPVGAFEAGIRLLKSDVMDVLEGIKFQWAQPVEQFRLLLFWEAFTIGGRSRVMGTMPHASQTPIDNPAVRA